MKKLLGFTVFLISNICLINTANILAILPMASPSHHIWNTPLVKTLAERGHNVTVVSPEAQKIPVLNLTDLVVTGLYEDADEKNDYEEMSEIPSIVMMNIFFDFMKEQCEKTLKSNAWTQLMNYPSDTKFDLVIIESIGTECLLGILPRFGNPPIVSVIAFNVPQWTFETSGTPNAISHMPHFMFSSTDHMTFLERVINLCYNVYTYYLYHYSYLPDMDKLAQEYYGAETPSYYETRKRISLEMASFHPVLDYSYATTPNLIHVAGIQIKEPKPLPEDLKQFLDDAKEGVIYFSLGSNVKSEKLSPGKRKAILDAFTELPQRILWKFEADSLPGQPTNVKIGKWLPQSDILAHPNVKVFVSHSGLLSTHEAIYRGVPLVGIPFFAEQPVNIQKVVNQGAGVRLEFKNLTKESLLQAIRAVLHDPSYRENMKILSERFRDDPLTPLERAVFWTEYVLRHNGAPHLQSAAKDLNIIQYSLLDVIAVLMTVPILLITVIYCVCCKKKSKPKKQKRS